jgi:hypothetical protein
LAITVPSGYFICEKCCGLMYPMKRPPSANVEDRMHQSNTSPKRCSRCASHQGADAESRIRRAEDHAQWYWEFAEQKDAEAKAARARATEAEAATEIQVGDARDRMISAFRSRDSCVRALAQIAGHHQPTRNGCSCRRRDCETLPIVDHHAVRSKINQLKLREGEYGADDSEIA